MCMQITMQNAYVIDTCIRRQTGVLEPVETDANHTPDIFSTQKFPVNEWTYVKTVEYEGLRMAANQRAELEAERDELQAELRWAHTNIDKLSLQNMRLQERHNELLAQHAHLKLQLLRERDKYKEAAAKNCAFNGPKPQDMQGFDLVKDKLVKKFAQVRNESGLDSDHEHDWGSD